MSGYSVDYLVRRRGEVDQTEWLDILWWLKAFNVPRNARIVELGAGEGLLLRFLMRHGYTRVRGYDLLYEDEIVKKTDLTIELPEPPFDVCISQHFLEHIPQERAVVLLRHCLRHGWLSINIVPGHYLTDPTHVINHYEYEDLVELAEKVGAPYYLIRPDTMSYLYPKERDWILVLSRKPIPRIHWPLLLRVAFKLWKTVLYRVWSLALKP